MKQTNLMNFFKKNTKKEIISKENDPPTKLKKENSSTKIQETSEWKSSKRSRNSKENHSMNKNTEKSPKKIKIIETTKKEKEEKLKVKENKKPENKKPIIEKREEKKEKKKYLSDCELKLSSDDSLKDEDDDSFAYSKNISSKQPKSTKVEATKKKNVHNLIKNIMDDDEEEEDQKDEKKKEKEKVKERNIEKEERNKNSKNLFEKTSKSSILNEYRNKKGEEKDSSKKTKIEIKEEQKKQSKATKSVPPLSKKSSKELKIETVEDEEKNKPKQKSSESSKKTPTKESKKKEPQNQEKNENDSPKKRTDGKLTFERQDTKTIKKEVWKSKSTIKKESKESIKKETKDQSPSPKKKTPTKQEEKRKTPTKEKTVSHRKVIETEESTQEATQNSPKIIESEDPIEDVSTQESAKPLPTQKHQKEENPSTRETENPLSKRNKLVFGNKESEKKKVSLQKKEQTPVKQETKEKKKISPKKNKVNEKTVPLSLQITPSNKPNNKEEIKNSISKATTEKKRLIETETTEKEPSHKRNKFHNLKTNEEAKFLEIPTRQRGDEDMDLSEEISEPNQPKKDLSKDENTTEQSKEGQYNYRNFVNRKGPQNLGKKEVPEGKQNCLYKKHFLVTGVLESFEREEIHEIIKRYGGTFHGNFVKSLTHMIAGREAGLSKMEKAKKSGNVVILDEDGFLDLIRNSKQTFIPLSEQKKINAKIQRESDKKCEHIKTLKENVEINSNEKASDQCKISFFFFFSFIHSFIFFII